MTNNIIRKEIKPMNLTNFDETMKPFFDKLEIDPIPLEYNENLNKFISTESFVEDDESAEEYFIVIKMTGNAGTVVIGYADGPKFIETETLGQIMFDKDKWVSLL